MNETEIFYHGTCHIFDKFSLSCVGNGEGHAKYGRVIYLSSRYKTAARYAAKAAKRNGKSESYVYTVEIPLLTDDNHIFSCKPVNPAIVERAEAAIKESIPDEAKEKGKYFRKYLGNLLTGERRKVSRMIASANAEAEDKAVELLDSLGIVFLAWPHAQSKPDGDTNRALLNEKYIKILKIEQVDVDPKNNYIEGSAREIKSF